MKNIEGMKPLIRIRKLGTQNERKNCKTSGILGVTVLLPGSYTQASSKYV